MEKKKSITISNKPQITLKSKVLIYKKQHISKPAKVRGQCPSVIVTHLHLDILLVSVT